MISEQDTRAEPKAVGVAGMSKKPPTPRAVEFNPILVRDISEAVYRDRLTNDDLAKMLAEDGAAKVRERAGAYDTLTRAYMRALGVGKGGPA